MTRQILEQRALKYAQLFDLALNFEKPLGYGNDGHVWRSDQNTAVKALSREQAYLCERNSYQRLQLAGVSEIGGLSVPKLINYHNDLMIVEMEVVSAPFLLDFGKVWLDHPPDYPDDAWEHWETEGQENFGHRWEEAKSIIRSLREYGIYYIDAKPGNINFGDHADS